ncbi:MAG: phosphomannomutase/phosphoglucomutase [Candidatus Azambacteria bacterium]|nr:phosphomannomutase/phosphoglucomutase [Candidatus Azambacteria bacterium]
MNQSIFKAYDVRGLYPQECDEDAAYRIAKATAKFLNAKKMLIAMDNRDSSPSLKAAVIKGLAEEGVAMIDAGVATTPMFYFAAHDSQADGGIMVTASHNPPQYNGLKIVGKTAMPIGEASGLPTIKEMALVDTGGEQKTEITPNIQAIDFLQKYADFLTKDARAPKIRVTVDAACGPAGMIVSEVAERMHIEVIPLCFAPCAVRAHDADPLKDVNTRDLVDAVVAQKADMGIALDGDGDRVFFFDNEGKRIPSHAIASLIAKDLLEQAGAGPIITDVRMPKIVHETVVNNGGTILESRVGHAFIKKLMREHNALFGAELSGHFYFRDFWGMDSGMMMIMRVLGVLEKTGKTIQELTQQYCVRAQSGELNFTVADKAAATAKLKTAFADGKQEELDGLTIVYPTWWCNVRPSNTEPYLRVNIEADTQELLNSMKEKIEAILNS